MLTAIMPAQAHISLLVLLSAGMLAISTVGEPGDQGAGITGTQGIGDPSAAITAGLFGEVQAPNGTMLTIGRLSMMLAAGIIELITRFFGNTTSELGAAPKVHVSKAPMQTCFGISILPLSAR